MHKTFKGYLKNNILILIKKLLFNEKLKYIKEVRDMMLNADNIYNFQIYDLLLTKLNMFYILLCKFILEITHIFYWDKYEYQNRKIVLLDHSGIDFIECLRIALKIGFSIQPQFESVISEYYEDIENEVKEFAKKNKVVIDNEYILNSSNNIEEIKKLVMIFYLNRVNIYIINIKNKIKKI